MDLKEMRRSIRFSLFACTLGTVGVAVLVWSRGLDRNTPNGVTNVSRRPGEARVMGLTYDPPYVRRSGSAAIASNLLTVELRERMKAARTSENIYRVAVAELAAGRLRIARDLLVEASAMQPENVAILNDLAAAEISLGRFAEAAEICGRASERDPQNAAVAFNWALALEQLRIRPVAIAAWERVLLLDGGSHWAEEAKEHLARLREPARLYEEQSRLLKPGANSATVDRVVRLFPQRSRGLAQNYILYDWMTRGNPADLSLLRQIASARAGLGDPYLQDIVEHAVANRDAIGAGLQEFAAARANEAKFEWDKAGEHFAKASALLDRAGSPLAIGAAIYAAQGEYTNGQSAAALARLTKVDEKLARSGHRYPVMAAESAWVRALVLGRMGEQQRSLDAYRFALTEATRGGEIEHTAALAGMLAWMLETLGDPAEADQYRLEALRRSDEIQAAPDRMYVLYLDAAWVALRSGRPHLALAFVDAMTPIARKENLPLHLAETEAWRALGLLELGRRDAARNRIDKARSHAMQIPMDAAREFTLANIEYTAGRLEMPARPTEAVTHFSAAVDLWKSREWFFHMASALLARAEAELAAGDVRAAERDLREGVARMEGQRATIEEPSVRIAYFERADRLFDRLIELLVDQGRVIDALSIAERKRARLLLDRIAAHDATPASPMDANVLARSVGKTTSILAITLLDRGAELWLIHNGRITHARSSANRSEIASATSRHLVAIAADDDAALQRTGHWLFEQLLQPLLPADGSGDLVIVADGELQSFPFGTLITDHGSYLIDSYTLSTAPSASVFLRSPTTKGGGVLAVAQPGPAGFERLPNAIREVRVIARMYQRGRIFTGSEVTPDAFLKAARDAALVHFAGHATADLDEPASSSLVFESPSGAPARLTAESIGRSTLEGHPLVIVAACGTARGKARRTEGVDSLAVAFLQAGARGVAATLWDVDDGVSSRLFGTFHRRLREGARPVDALQEAQRSLLHSSDPRDRRPSVWGGVTLIGTL
jgi:CHAT domain-containing protein